MKKVLFNKIIISAMFLSVLFVAYILTRHDYIHTRAEDFVDPLAPPVCNFYEPVDYIKWANQRLIQNRKPESVNIYDDLWGYSNKEGMPDPPDDIKEQLRRLTNGPVWKAEDHPQMIEYIQSIEKYLEIFLDAANKEVYTLQFKKDMTDDPLDILPVLPWAASGRYAVRVLIVKAWQDGARHLQDLIAAWRVALNHARHLEDSKMFILIIQGITVRQLVYESIRWALFRGVIDEENYPNILKMMVDSENSPINKEDALYGQWSATLTMHQELYRGGRLNKKFAETFASGHISKLKRSKMKPDELALRIDEYFLKLIETNKRLSGIELWKGIGDVAREVRNVKMANHPLRYTFFQDYKETYLLELVSIAEHRGTHLILLIQQHHSINKKWPMDLSELKLPNGARDLIIDPFSEKHFVYQIKGDDFILYSVGADGIDNQANHHKWQFYKLEPNTDFVFWPPK